MLLHDIDIDPILVETFLDGHAEIRQGMTDVIYLSEVQLETLKQYLSDMVGEE